MTRLFLVLMLMPLAAAADDVRILYLEQEVRNLQRQVQTLSRQLDEVRTRPARPARETLRPAAKSAETLEESLPRWVDAASWRSLRAGMSELEVLSVLGAPTSMRDEGGARVLLYALEIGQSGFLGGNVKLRERKVTEIAQPTLQ
jgi:hypothetical protein